MPRLSRFTKQEVDHVFATASRIFAAQGIVILVAPKMHDSGRILVITPGHVGSAVQRNTIRRRLKSLFYEEKLFDKGYDWVVIVKKSGATLSFEQLTTIMQTSCERLDARAAQ